MSVVVSARERRDRAAQLALSLLGLVIAICALYLSFASNSTAEASLQKSDQSLAVALDSAQRYQLSESFSGCFFGMSFSTQMGPIAPGEIRPSTNGADRWVVLTNTGRLPVSILGITAQMTVSGQTVEVGYSFLPLSTAGSLEPQTGPIYLEPSQAVALHTALEVPGNSNAVKRYAYLLADATSDPIEPKMTAGAGEVPAALAGDFARLGASNFDACRLTDARPKPDN
ncbi:hypothetical protein [Subtercola endophyticus]|uniref:hypothetical protein n=1 Tax=Subtercola endophyticus TaxID=2895559 RepID=UPI001E475204|nr:hypothetical protein [Subtercola endophyticus]UFS58392.1 hypothetical protein LQ955_15490 [Subtercola endophyticus]